MWAENAYFIFTNLIKVGSKSDIKQRKFDFYIYWDDTADKKVSLKYNIGSNIFVLKSFEISKILETEE